jgi:hypothetical protein
VDVAGVSAAYTAALAQRRSSLGRQLRLFGSGGWGPQLSATGSYRSLAGRSVGSLRLASSAAASATLDAVGSRLVGSLPRRSRLIPSPLAGSISGLLPGDSVAFALNGRIAAVTEVYRDRADGPPRFSALAPESAFRPGRNSVRAFLVTGPATTPQLHELRVRLSD